MDYKKREDILKLNQDVAMNGFIYIYCNSKKNIKDYNAHVHQHLIDTQGGDIRSMPETAYCEIINKMYLDKQ